MKNLPKDLTTLSEKQIQEVTEFLTSLTLGTLRKRQTLVNTQISAAHAQRNDAALNNLRVKENLLTVAIDTVAFA